jgi:hypothetical protein
MEGREAAMKFNLFVGLFWLLTGCGLLAVHYTAGPVAGMQSGQVVFVGVFALVLAAYNFVRWWAGRVSAKSRNSPQPPPRKRPVDEVPKEYNPELDFTRPEPPN